MNFNRNMTSFFEEIREMVYFQLSAYKDIYAAFDFYLNKDLNPKKSDIIDKLGLSYASWDFHIIQKEFVFSF